jgi:hypothetical protein
MVYGIAATVVGAAAASDLYQFRCAPVKAHKPQNWGTSTPRGLAMLTIVAASFILAAIIGAALIALGWVSDTTQAGRRWYPAAPDPEPCRSDS